MHFHWDDAQPHNVIQVALFEGNDSSIGTYSDAHWPGELFSGAKSVKGTFDWNGGQFPCGYRPGLYYLVDEGNAAGGINALSYTAKGNPDAEYPGAAGFDCVGLADPNKYGGRYAEFASRAACTLREVNNFQTQSHFDWVPPTFASHQGDLLIFRWSGLHNVVQTHDQSKDQPVPGGVVSGHRTNCVPGADYLCANGSPYLGEYLIDTQDYRPGIVHLSDQCAYGCESCPEQCDNPTNRNMYYGTAFSHFIQRPVRPTPPTAGACCAIDKTKGQACRVIDLYNDNDGMQFDTGLGGGITVNRGDLVRFRWSGALKIVQTKAESTQTGVASTTPFPGGAGMAASVDCVPGPHWTCLSGMTAEAEFVFDVERAMTAGRFETFSYGGAFFDFYAFADNSNDPYKTTQDSAVVLPVASTNPYADNPACP